MVSIIASEMFLNFTAQLYQYFSVFFFFAPISDEPEVFLPEYFQTAIVHAAHFQSVVKHTEFDSKPNVPILFFFLPKIIVPRIDHPRVLLLSPRAVT